MQATFIFCWTFQVYLICCNRTLVGLSLLTDSLVMHFWMMGCELSRSMSPLTFTTSDPPPCPFSFIFLFCLSNGKFLSGHSNCFPKHSKLYYCCCWKKEGPRKCTFQRVLSSLRFLTPPCSTSSSPSSSLYLLQFRCSFARF